MNDLAIFFDPSNSRDLLVWLLVTVYDPLVDR